MNINHPLCLLVYVNKSNTNLSLVIIVVDIVGNKKFIEASSWKFTGKSPTSLNHEPLFGRKQRKHRATRTDMILYLESIPAGRNDRSQANSMITSH